jgi:octaprenyl-diphosphate synthase
LKQCSAKEKNLIKKVVQHKAEGAERLLEIVALIHKYDGVNYALAKAKDYIDNGENLLGIFPDSDAKASLLTISHYIVERRF